MGSDFIYTQDNFLTRGDCDAIIERFEKSNQVRPGITKGGYNPKYKQQMEIDLVELGKNMEISISTKIKKLIGDYVTFLHGKGCDRGNVISTNLNPRYISSSGCMIQKSGVGDFYRWHFDSNFGLDTRNNEVYNRLLSVIVYLNDMEEGCGGTTDFFAYGSVKPKCGKVLIFPATWDFLHRGKRVEKGYKYILTTFIHAGNIHSQ
jgi:hypothetical protein